MNNHSDTIRLLSKQWLETGDHIFLDELKDVRQRKVDPKDLKIVHSSLIERYEQGSLSFHFHFTDRFAYVGEIS